MGVFRVRRRRSPLLLTHLLVLVRVDGGVAHGAPEASGAARRPDLALRVGVLAREAEVQHEDVAHGRRGAADGEVGRLDVAVQEAHVVDGLDALQDLRTVMSDMLETEASQQLLLCISEYRVTSLG